MLTCDMHSDTLLECWLHGTSLRENPYCIDANKLKEGEALLQCFAAFLPTHETALSYGITDDAYTVYKKMAAYMRAELDKNRDMLTEVHSVKDLETARETGRPGAMFTVEDMGAMLEGSRERLEEAYKDGVRMMSVTWNYENCLAYPNSTDPGIMGKGLKPFGFEILEYAQSLGMAVDVSHLSDGGFLDIASHAKKPFAASHSSCRALCPHPRNLTDEMLRILSDKGGVAGVNYFGEFLRADGPKLVTAELAVDHIRHMYEVGGEDLPALGSDYDGMDSELAWKDASGTQALVREMEKRGFTPRLIEKICYKNVCRFLSDTIG